MSRTCWCKVARSREALDHCQAPNSTALVLFHSQSGDELLKQAGVTQTALYPHGNATFVVLLSTESDLLILRQPIPIFGHG